MPDDFNIQANNGLADTTIGEKQALDLNLEEDFGWVESGSEPEFEEVRGRSPRLLHLWAQWHRLSKSAEGLF